MAALAEATLLHAALEKLIIYQRQIDIYMLGLAEGGVKLNEATNAVHTHLASLGSLTKDMDVRLLFREIERLQIKLDAALKEGMRESVDYPMDLSALEAFADAYSTYLQSQVGVNAYPLLTVARRLHTSLVSLDGYLHFLHLNLAGQLDQRENEAELSLVLGNIFDLSDFAKKLEALQVIYVEVCFLLEVSVASHPLRIAKIESGSLWTRLFGDTRAVGLMISLIERSVQYLHRNYTTEGKIASIPGKIQSMNSILDFSNKLKEKGVDVAPIQEKLAKCGVKIAESLTTLVSGQAEVEVNGQLLSLEQLIQRAALAQYATPKLSLKSSVDSPLKLDKPGDTSVPTE